MRDYDIGEEQAKGEADSITTMRACLNYLNDNDNCKSLETLRELCKFILWFNKNGYEIREKEKPPIRDPIKKG